MRARLLHRRFSVEVEMALAALVLLAWQVGRLPLEGSVDASLDHARSVLRFEESLSLDVEEGLVELAESRPALDSMLQWAYAEIHTPVLFAFLAAACVLAPDRYPSCARRSRSPSCSRSSSSAYTRLRLPTG